MSDIMLTTGDMAIFEPTFGQAIVTVLPGVLAGSGPATLDSKTICLDGDESSVVVPGCPYISGAFVTPGVGILMIDSLGSDQLTTKTTYQGKAIMLQGSNFVAKFQVLAPAIEPSVPPVPDPTPEYSGQGSFLSVNINKLAT